MTSIRDLDGDWRVSRAIIDSATRSRAAHPASAAGVAGGGDLAPIPLPNHDNLSRRKHAASARGNRPHGGRRLGCAKGLGQSPAKSRDLSGRLALSPRILRTRRLVGGAGSPPRTGLSAPNSLIHGKIQGIRADSGSDGLAIGPVSLACTETCAPGFLEPVTGNLAPRSREFAWRRSAPEGPGWPWRNPAPAGPIAIELLKDGRVKSPRCAYESSRSSATSGR